MMMPGSKRPTPRMHVAAIALLAVLFLTPRAPADAVASVSAESIRVTDRVTLDITFTIPRGSTLQPWAASARNMIEDAGWSVIAWHTDAPSIFSLGEDSLADSDRQISHNTRVILEPFLAGDYTIPSISVQVLGGAHAGETPGDSRVLTTSALSITVTSVLPEDEPARLPLPVTIDEQNANPQDSDGAHNGQADAPLGTLRAVPDEPVEGPGWIMLSIAGFAVVVAVIAGGVAIRSARQVWQPREPSAVLALEKIARSKSPDLAIVDRHVRTLAKRDAHGVFEQLLARIERARYARRESRADGQSEASDHTGAVALAKDAAAIAREIARADQGVGGHGGRS